MAYEFRALCAADQPVVWAMLRHAAHEPSVEAVRGQPELARYAAGWGRDGDMGVLALHEAEPVGAAWLRLWREGDRGFGHVADDIPELAMAVLPEYRGQGVGTRLLTLLLEAARPRHAAVSLSVRGDSPALRLYRRHGFRTVAGSEMINRTGGVSVTMLWRRS